jgi:hypothetical protein
MKGWIALVAGGFGLAAYFRRHRRRGRAEIAPADELRAKLAESKAGQPAAEPVVEPVVVPVVEVAPDAAPDALDDRRRSVHDTARSALDELR